jgi:GTP-binding protein Era
MKSGFIAIIGQPNVGKSTLLNRFIGESLAIVTPKPQTTRQNIKGILNKKDVQAIFLDTPGFHESTKLLNKVMVEKVGEALADADVAVLMMEPKKKTDDIDRTLFNKISGVGKKIIAINKIDTVMGKPWGEIVEKYWKEFDETPTVAISATKGANCDILLDKIIEFLPEGEPFYPVDEYTEHPVRFLAAEIIREQAMLTLHQELPYSLAVEIDEFKDAASAGGITRIRAFIIVEKDSQKAIVIGSGGSMIKKIGTLARVKIEALVGTKVFLELFAKVEPNWTRDPNIITKLGL